MVIATAVCTILPKYIDIDIASININAPTQPVTNSNFGLLMAWKNDPDVDNTICIGSETLKAFTSGTTSPHCSPSSKLTTSAAFIYV